MAFTPVLFTSLAVWGGPGPASTPLYESASVTDTLSVAINESPAAAGVLQELSGTDTLSVTLTESASLVTAEARYDVTELRPYTSPGPYHDIGAKTPASIVDVAVSDTLSVQWLEEPVDEQYITNADTLRVSLAEVSALHNRIDVTDVLTFSFSELIGVLQVGVTLKTASDTLSVTLTETTAVDVTVAATDTVSVTFSGESATVDTTILAKDVTDTLSVSVADDSLLEVFVGTLTVNVNDDLRVLVSDTSAILSIVEVDVANITFEIRKSRMRFEFL